MNTSVFFRARKFNGNGRPDYIDSTLFFKQLEWTAANEPVAAFDMNRNGSIEFDDVVWLYQEFGLVISTAGGVWFRIQSWARQPALFHFHYPFATSLIPPSRIPLFMDPIIERIRQELNNNADPEIRKTSQRFFKENVMCYGMKTAAVIAIAKKYWKEVNDRPKPEIFALCEELYRSGYLEESFIVSHWAHALSGRYERGDLAVFRSWIDTYITNWASCDGFCNHTMGDFIELYPEYIDELKRWTQSENRWMRRAAAVSLIVPAKQGKFLIESIAIADLLLTDSDDMVQKGYGWLLKEASRKHTGEVFSFVLKKKKQMPRTALRYAIELMPKDLKAQAMKKDW